MSRTLTLFCSICNEDFGASLKSFAMPSLLLLCLMLVNVDIDFVDFGKAYYGVDTLKDTLSN